MIRLLAVLLLAALPLVATGEPHRRPPPPTTTQGHGAALVEAVLVEALTALQERYLHPVELAELAAGALSGLATFDSGFALARPADDWRLSLDGRVVAHRVPPATADAVGWAQLVAAFAQAASASAPVRDAGRAALLGALMDGATAQLDPFTRYVPPPEARAAEEARRGGGGIGVRAVPSAGGALIVDVLADSPAEHAGLVVGDRILAIDGARLHGLGEAAIAARLAGREDTRVVLSLRSRRGQARRLALIRTLVVPRSVTWERRGSVAVLQVSTFNRLTDQHLARTLMDALAAPVGPSAFILDLRGNRGGLLRQAVSAADLFLADGEIAATRGRHPDAARTYVASAADLIGGLPLVVLVDGATASAAEIVAAALQGRGRAAVVGSATLGKGLVQTVIRLADGGELVMTWSRVIVPPGRPLQGEGVLPSLCTAFGPAATLRGLAELDRAPPAPPAGMRPLPEAQLARAIARGRADCPPGAGGSGDLDAALALLADARAMAAATGMPRALLPGPLPSAREHLAGAR